MKTDEIVKFHNIHKSYFLGEVEIKALRDISFTVTKDVESSEMQTKHLEGGKYAVFYTNVSILSW